MNARIRPTTAPTASAARFALLTLTLLGASLLSAAAPLAAEVKIFRAESRDAFLEGTLEGIRVGPLGALELAVPSARLASLSEPFAFAAAGHPEGWVVGTGNSGKVLRVDAEGDVDELFAAPEPEVFAVWADKDGTVYAGSSPNGKVYRIDKDGGAEVFDPQATYVWALARDRQGRLLVATGLPGRLWRLKTGKTETEAELLLDGRDSHVRSLAVLPDGTVLAGTAGQGLVLRIAPDGTVTTLHDAVYPEVLTFAAAPGGKVYAALVASEASQVDLSKRTSSSSSGSSGDGDSDGSEVKVIVVSQGEETAGSRSASFKGPRSSLVEITPAGGVEEILALDDATIHSLLARDDGLWIGTGQEGRLYRYQDGRLIQERVYDEQQLAAMARGSRGDAVVTANGAAVYRLGSGREAEGTYTSAVLDAGQVARFGSFLWEGMQPPGSEAEIALRTGMSSRPDATWSEWSCQTCDLEPCRDGEAGCRGGRREAALGDLARGRYVQWRATFRGRGEASPRLTAAELTYRQLNLKPRVTELEVLSPGEILVPNAFNPGNQSFEPWSPNREGIFTTLRSEPSKNGDSRLKTLWKKGYRTLRWEAEDANEDELAYRLEFHPAGGAGEEPDGVAWLPVASELDQDHYSFDATVLPDGVYRFRVVASDEPAHAEGEALEDERLSEPVVIDHSPPRLAGVERRGRVLEVTVVDELSPLRGAEVSSDAGEWRAARTADGLLDGRRETLRVEVPEGARMMLLRLTDAAFNVVTFDLLKED